MFLKCDTFPPTPFTDDQYYVHYHKSMLINIPTTCCFLCNLMDGTIKGHWELLLHGKCTTDTQNQNSPIGGGEDPSSLITIVENQT